MAALSGCGSTENTSWYQKIKQCQCYSLINWVLTEHICCNILCLCLCIPGCLCVPCCLVGSIPLGNIGWLPGTPPSPYRGKRIHHQHYHHCHKDTVHFYYPKFCLLPAGVSVALTWLGNLRGGLGPPGYRGDINGWINRINAGRITQGYKYCAHNLSGAWQALRVAVSWGCMSRLCNKTLHT